ncbi:MAG: 2TM domain-containing protein [Saprospiraceae bacterium]|nr:2TM domain-containing protein [Saprospiraceae bacterium]
MSFQDEEYEAARKRVKLKKGFYRHLAGYMVIGAFFFIMNITTDPTDVWFHFPMIAWGIGLAFHYIGVFGIPYVGALDKSWEAEEIARELARMRGNNRGHQQKQLLNENHEIDELDLNNKYHFEKEEEDLDKWNNYDNRGLKEIRKDFDDEFKR